LIGISRRNSPCLFFFGYIYGNTVYAVNAPNQVTHQLYVRMFFKMKKLLWFSFLVLALVGCTSSVRGIRIIPSRKLFFGTNINDTRSTSENPSPLKPAATDDKEVIVSSRDWLELSGQLLETGELLRRGTTVRASLLTATVSFKSFYDLPYSHTNMTATSHPWAIHLAWRLRSQTHFSPKIKRRLDGTKAKVQVAAGLTQINLADLVRIRCRNWLFKK